MLNAENNEEKMLHLDSATGTKLESSCESCIFSLTWHIFHKNVTTCGFQFCSKETNHVRVVFVCCQ